MDPITQYILEQETIGEEFLEERLPLGVALAGLIGTKLGIQAMSKSGIDPGITFVVAVGTLVTIITWGAYATYRDHFSRAAKVCKKMTQDTSKKEDCIDRYRAASRRQQINILRKGMSLCGRSKDPAKCKTKLSNEIKHVEGRMS